MKKILITGGTGALGRMVIDKLIRLENYQIYVVSSKEAFINARVTVMPADFRCPEQLTAAFDLAEPDLVLHLGAVVTKDLPEAYMMNVAPAVHFLELIKQRKLKTRIILIGSAAEYGVVKPEENPIREDHSLFPVSVYGLSKAWQTQLLGLYAAQGVDVLCARIFNLFGPGSSDHLFAGRIQNQIDEIKHGKKSNIEIGSLSAVRDYVSTQEAARQLLLIASRGISGTVYHIGSGRAISMRDFLIERLEAEGLSSSLIHESSAHSNHHGYDVPVIFADMYKTRALEQEKINV